MRPTYAIAILASCLWLTAGVGDAGATTMLDTAVMRCAANSSCTRAADAEEIMEAGMASATHWVDCAAEGASGDAAGFARAACASLMRALGTEAEVRRVPDGASLHDAAFGAGTDRGIRLVLDIHGGSQASARLEHGSLSAWSKGKSSARRGST